VWFPYLSGYFLFRKLLPPKIKYLAYIQTKVCQDAIREIGGYVYKRSALNIGTAAAKAAGVKFSHIGTVVDCPTLADLTSLYQYFFSGANSGNFEEWNKTNTRFRDLGSRAYFKVKGFVVQTWALVTEVDGKLTEGAGKPPQWIPVYASFDALTDPVFDDPRVVSLNI
jgi:hypothetical protein